MSKPTSWLHDRPHFYKYVTRDTARAILLNRKLRWSTPARFNDPFDIQFDLHVDTPSESTSRKILDRLWEAHYGASDPIAGNRLGRLIAAVRGRFPRLTRAEFDEQFSGAIDEGLAASMAQLPSIHAQMRANMLNVKILCLSETYDSILMWSHYAEQHMGAVLRLRCIQEIDSAWGAAKPVKYSSFMPKLFDEDAIIRLMSGEMPISVPDILDRTVFTKAAEWSYEKEWRLFAGEGRSAAIYEDIPFNALEFDAIILGCRMPPEHCLEFSSLVAQRYPHAHVFQAIKAAKEFRLEVQATMSDVKSRSAAPI